jgi:TonB family protein
MSTEFPPGSSRPTAGGEFTWPPTSEELEAIQVIPLDDTSAPRASLLPAPLEASAVTAAAPAIKRRRLRLPRRDDFSVLGVTFASALAIAVGATSQLADWDWQIMPSHQSERSDAPLTPPAATSLPATSPAAATSSAADLAILRLLEEPPDVARAALAATPAPLAALAKEASPAAPVKKVADARVRRAPRMAQRVAPRVVERRRVTTPASTAAIPASTAAYVRPRLISPEDHGRRGKLVLWVEVRKNGKVGDVDVLSSDLDRSERSQRDLQRAAVSAVKRWRYTPAMRDGEPTDTRVRVVVDINLDSARVIRTATAADARRMGAAANRVADSVRAAR